MCRHIIENEFKSAIKGDGLQPYRMNKDDQLNLSGLQGMIILGKLADPNAIPLFSWSNANQLQHEHDWHFSQILGLIQEFGMWKTLVLKRQDDIKEQIMKARTENQINRVKIDYSDLLDFGGDDNG
jgi:hypothetical protein